MKKKLSCSFIVIALCCLLSLASSAQSCTPVSKISSFLYTGFIIGEENTMELRAENGSIYLRGVFTVTSGTLPPGVTLQGNKITGIPTAIGTYIFTIGASSNAGCPVFQRTFTLKVSWNLPCNEFAITSTTSYPPIQIGYIDSVIFQTEHFDSVQYTAVSLPPGFSLNHIAGSYQAAVTGSPEYAGPDEIILAAQTNKGCRDIHSIKIYMHLNQMALHK